MPKFALAHTCAVLAVTLAAVRAWGLYAGFVVGVSHLAVTWLVMGVALMQRDTR